MRLKNLIEAKPAADMTKTLDAIGDATDRNDHTEARLIIARLVKEKKLEKILNGIKELHNEMGHMPAELIKLRNGITDELMKVVERKLGRDAANQINDKL